MRIKKLSESFTRHLGTGWVEVLAFSKRVMLAVRPALVAGVVLGAVSAIIPIRSALAETLDNAVNRQLAPSLSENCVVLLGAGASRDDPFVFLTGTLQQICALGVSFGAPPPSSATGGAAATPATVPAIVQKRLREAPKKETRRVRVSAASADAVTEFRSGLSVFVSSQFESLDRDVTTFEDGYDSDIWRVTAGADYRFTRHILAGLAFDYSRQDGDFENQGDFRNDLYSVIAYSSFLPTERAYLQVVAGYTQTDNLRKRFASWTEDVDLITGGFIDADYNGTEYRAGALLGYDFLISGITISPRAGVDWRRTEFDTYSETGLQTQGDIPADIPITGSTGLELRFDEDEVTSLQARFGVQASVAFKTGFGKVVPQASFDWKHEYDNDQRDVTVSFVEDLRLKRFTFQTDEPERDWGEISAGIVTVLHSGTQILANYKTIVGHSFFNSHAGIIALRVPF